MISFSLISQNLTGTWKCTDGGFAGKTLTRSAEPETTVGNISGEWNSTYEKITFKQTGNEVSGTYEWMEGRIKGTLDENVLTGMWYQTNGRGKLVMTFHDNFSRFTSKYFQDGKWYNDWTGERFP